MGSVLRDFFDGRWTDGPIRQVELQQCLQHLRSCLKDFTLSKLALYAGAIDGGDAVTVTSEIRRAGGVGFLLYKLQMLLCHH